MLPGSVMISVCDVRPGPGQLQPQSGRAGTDSISQWEPGARGLSTGDSVSPSCPCELWQTVRMSYPCGYEYLLGQQQPLHNIQLIYPAGEQQSPWERLNSGCWKKQIFFPNWVSVLFLNYRSFGVKICAQNWPMKAALFCSWQDLWQLRLRWPPSSAQSQPLNVKIKCWFVRRTNQKYLETNPGQHFPANYKNWPENHSPLICCHCCSRPMIYHWSLTYGLMVSCSQATVHWPRHPSPPRACPTCCTTSRSSPRWPPPPPRPPPRPPLPSAPRTRSTGRPIKLTSSPRSQFRRSLETWKHTVSIRIAIAL